MLDRAHSAQKLLCLTYKARIQVNPLQIHLYIQMCVVLYLSTLTLVYDVPQHWLLL